MSAATDTPKQTVDDLVKYAADLERNNLQAFRGMDASVFREWAMAVSDVMACGAAHADPRSVPTAFGLVYQLIKAADELEEKEREEMRKSKAA